MANVDIRVGKKDAAFFAANPTLILKNGQFIFNETTSLLYIGNGVTQLSALTAINIADLSNYVTITNFDNSQAAQDNDILNLNQLLTNEVSTINQRLDNIDNTIPDLVPYTGANQNVNLGEYELKAGQVTLDITPTGIADVGTTRWNDTIGSSETTLKGGNVVLKNGVDLVARVVNKVTPNTTLTKADYQAVRVSGAQGQRLAVALAQANNDNNSADTIGLVIETITTNQEGFIMTVGQLEGINTTGSLQGETWVDGDVIYLSPTVAGKLTNVKPTAPQHIVIIGYVEYAHANNGKLYVKVMNGWELEELHNVSSTNYTTPIDTDSVLTYDVTNDIWKRLTWSNVKSNLKTYFDTIYTTTSAVASQITTALTGYATQAWVASQGYITNVVTALGYTPENVANKENTTLDTSSTKYPTNNLVKTNIDAKVTANAAITGATKTKITYDSKGLVTSGADATTADITDSVDKRYVTDANLVVIGNTSGTNTGDETQSSIQTKLGLASTSTSGYLSSTDWNTFNNKQNALGFTPENVANKSDSYTVSSTTTYASTKALVDGLASVGGSPDEELFYISAFKSLYNY